MTHYFKTSFWTSLAAIFLIIMARIIELSVGQHFYPQWELFVSGIIFLFFCLLATIGGVGGHKDLNYQSGAKEKEGCAYDIPLLSTALGFFLGGMIISELGDDWTALNLNFIFLIIAMIFIAKVMLLMVYYHGRPGTGRPARIPAMTMKKLGNLFKNIMLQIVVTVILIAATLALSRLPRL